MDEARKAAARGHWTYRLMRSALEIPYTELDGGRRIRLMYALLDACFFPMPTRETEPWVDRPTQRGRQVGGVRRWEPSRGGDVIRFGVNWPGRREHTVESIETHRFVDILGELWHTCNLDAREQTECRDKIMAWCSIDERDGQDTPEAQRADLAETIKLRQRLKASNPSS